MNNLPNIEASGFRKGSYVGYSKYVWRISRAPGGWRGVNTTTDETHTEKTLEAFSAWLTGQAA